jgi:PAS domain S-box-containing protein
MKKITQYFLPTHTMGYFEKQKSIFFVWQLYFAFIFILTTTLYDFIFPSQNFSISLMSKLSSFAFLLFVLFFFKKKGVDKTGNIYSLGIAIILAVWLNIIPDNVPVYYKYIQGFYSIFVVLIFAMFFASLRILLIIASIFILTTTRVLIYAINNNANDIDLYTYGYFNHLTILIIVTVILYFTKRFSDFAIKKANLEKQIVQKQNKELLASEEELRAAHEERFATTEALKEKNDDLLAVEEKLKANNESLTKLNEKLLESELRYGMLSDLNIEGVVIHKHGIVYDVNKSVSQITGYSKTELLNENFIEHFIQAEDINLVIKHILNNKKGKITVRGKRKDKQNIWVELESREYNYRGEVVMATAIRDVTENVKKDTALKKSKEQFQLLFDNLPNPLVLAELIYNDKGEAYNYKIIKANPVFTKFRKKLHGEITGTELNKETVKYWVSIGKKLIEEKKHVTDEFYSKDINAYFFITGYYISENRFGVIFQNITKRKQNEKRIKKLSIAVEQSANTIVITDTQGNIEYVNPKFTKTTGYTEQEVLGQNPRILNAGILSKEYYTELWNTITSGNVWQGEFCNKTKSGKLFWERVLITPITNNTGEIINYLAVKEDITRQKEIEKVIKEREKIFSTFMDNTPIYAYIKDENYKLIYTNKYLKDFFKNINVPYDAVSNVIEKNVKTLIINADKDILKERYSTKTIEFSTKITGKELWILDIKFPIQLDDNKILLGGVSFDITNLKKTETELKESNLRFKQLADSTIEGIFIHKEGIIIDVNKSLLKITGYNKKEVIGKDIKMFVAEKYYDYVEAQMKVSSKVIYEIEAVKKDGLLLTVEVTSQFLSKKDDLRIVSFRDITEQKQIQQKILSTVIQTEENERKRVAQELHDGIGPLLSTIKLYTQTYIASDNKEKRKKIEEQLIISIDDALTQISEISNNLSPHVLTDFGLKTAIEKYIVRITKVADINFEFNYNIKNKISQPVEITLYRVAIELINNTIKYAQASKIILLFDEKSEDIKFIYKDNGKGFDFEMTKRKGFGMGLFNIINRVKSFKGNVIFERGKKNGIVYDITLPKEY